MQKDWDKEKAEDKTGPGFQRRYESAVAQRQAAESALARATEDAYHNPAKAERKADKIRDRKGPRKIEEVVAVKPRKLGRIRHEQFPAWMLDKRGKQEKARADDAVSRLQELHRAVNEARNRELDAKRALDDQRRREKPNLGLNKEKRKDIDRGSRDR